MNKPRITTMTSAHVPAIAALEAETFSAPWDEASLRGELDNPLALWLAAVDESGTVLGYVGSQTCFEDADLLNLAVRPEARRRGIARTLLETLEGDLAVRGAERITLEVRASNTPAIALYQTLGYTPLGLRKGYYEKPREDALILQKSLPGRKALKTKETGENE